MISAVKETKQNNKYRVMRGVGWQVYVISDQRVRKGFFKEMPFKLRFNNQSQTGKDVREELARKRKQQGHLPKAGVV